VKDFPKIIATKADIDFLISNLGSPSATVENKKKGLVFLNGLLNTKVYQFDKTLTATEPATGPEPDYKVLENQGENNDERHQFVFVEDPNAKIHKLGLTVAQVQDYITQVEGAV